MAVWSPLISNVHELHGSREENFEGENSFANVTLQCEANASSLLIADLLNNQRPYPFNESIPYSLFAKNAFRRYPPEKYTTDADQQIINYNGFDAFVTVQYRRKRFCEIIIDPITLEEISITEEIESITEFLTQEDRVYFWVNKEKDTAGNDLLVYEQLKPKEIPGLLLPRIALRRHIEGLSTLNPIIFSLVGKVNDKEYESTYLNTIFHKETLLMMPPIVKFTYCASVTINNQTSHVKRWEVSLTLLHKDDGEVENVLTEKKEHAGWNHVWRAKTQKWQRTYLKLEQTKEEVNAYKLADFSPILFLFGGRNKPKPPSSS